MPYFVHDEDALLLLLRDGSEAEDLRA